MRKFEKISFKQFKNDIVNDEKLYNEYNLPVRSTKYAAGYDFEALYDFILHPKETIKIPTGIKVIMNDDKALFLIIRSSMGFKYNIRLCNQVGVIDKVYYNNIDNEGHIFIKLQNEGNKDYCIKKGDKICQGIFIKYLKIDNEIANNNERFSDK